MTDSPRLERSAERPPDVSVVVPCYGSQATLPELAARLDQALRRAGRTYELLLVNDASPDETWAVIERLAAERPEVRGVDLMFRTGQYRATWCGLEQARGELIVTMDDDLQHPPEAVPELLRVLDADPACDAVLAALVRKRQPLLRRLGGRLMHGVYAALYGKPPGLEVSSFRALRRRTVAAMLRCGTANPNLNALLFQLTSRIANTPVAHQPRRAGRSGYRLKRLVRIAADSVFGASTAPLRCVSLLGLLAAGAASLLAAYYLIRYCTTGFRVAGFATLVLLILFFGGASLLAIGLLGEYLIRILDEVRRPPRYAVRRTTRARGDSPPGRGV